MCLFWSLVEANDKDSAAVAAETFGEDVVVASVVDAFLENAHNSCLSLC